jgi:hypothetical protein
VAQSAASFERLGVDSMAARRLRVTRGGETLVDVLVSERGPDFQSAYVRVPGDSNVYAVAGRLAAVARRTQDDWRDKTVATVIPDSVAAIELERGGRRSVIRRRDGAWHLATGTGTDTTAVRRVVERYRQVNASGFPSEAQLDSIFRGRVERRATLRDARGAALVSLEFDSTEGGFWARRPGAGRAGVYRLNTWDVDELVPADSALRIK